MPLLNWLAQKRTLHAAITAMKEGRLRDAVTGFTQYLEGSPNDWQAWEGLGECHVALGNNSAAEQACNRSLELNPVGVEAKQCLALLYADRQQWDSCFHFLDEAWEQVKDDFPQFLEIDYAWCYHLKGDEARGAGVFRPCPLA